MSERPFCGALREIAKDRPRVDTQSRRDFWRSEATGTQLLHPAGLDFRRPFLPATVHAFTLRSRNPSCLAFAAIFLFHRGQANHDIGAHSSYRTMQVNWLRDGDNPHAFLAPFCQEADAFMLAAGQTVQFPDDDGFHRPIKNSFLKLVKGGPFERRTTLLIDTALFVWMSRFVATAFPLTLSLSRKGRGNPRTASSYKCKPL